MKKKDLNIEYIRIIACLMVILIHVSATLMLNYNVGTYNWQICNIFDTLGRAAVPVFVMISGILFLNPNKDLTIKKLYSKYVFKMVLIVIFGTIAYSLISCLILDWYSFSLSEFLKHTLIVPYHFWYFSVIIFLYILTPLLRKITRVNDDSIPKYIAVLLLICSLLITLKSCKFIPYYRYVNNILNALYLDHLFFWSGYYLLGYYIYNTSILDKYKKISYLLAIFGFGLCIYLTSYSSNLYGTNYFKFYSKSCFPSFTMATAIIFYMKSIKINDTSRKIIEYFSSSTFGIYIAHVMVLQILLFKTKVFELNMPLLILIPLITLLIFALSLILVKIYKLVLQLFKKCRKTLN